MTPIHCTIAKTQEELDNALRVRWGVFGDELGLLAARPPFVEREGDCFDTLATTVHFVAYAERKAIGTARLLLANTEVARANDWDIGLDLERKFDLSDLVRPGVNFAETTRLCVLRAWRRSGALAALDAAMRRESRARGVTHWVAAANTETASFEDARIAYRVASHLGFVSRRWRVEPRDAPVVAEAPSCAFYTSHERRRAQYGEIEGLRLPSTLKLFASKMGARFVGEAVYDPRFRRYAMPLVADLAQRQLQQSDHPTGRNP